MEALKKGYRRTLALSNIHTLLSIGSFVHVAVTGAISLRQSMTPVEQSLHQRWPCILDVLAAFR